MFVGFIKVKSNSKLAIEAAHINRIMTEDEGGAEHRDIWFPATNLVFFGQVCSRASKADYISYILKYRLDIDTHNSAFRVLVNELSWFRFP